MDHRFEIQFMLMAQKIWKKKKPFWGEDSHSKRPISKSNRHWLRKKAEKLDQKSFVWRLIEHLDIKHKHNKRPTKGKPKP